MSEGTPILLDSITRAGDLSGRVVLSGSHGGAYAAYLAVRAKALAVAVAKWVNTTRPPEGLEGLHEAALGLAQGYAEIAASVQAHLGLPTAGEAARIGRTLADLAAQRGALARDYEALALRRWAFRLR